MNKLFLTLTYGLSLTLTMASQASASHAHLEKYYQTQWCQEHHGQMEVTLPNRTRCDCLTDTYAVEVEFAEKWAEGIGQSLNYALQAQKRAGIVFIMESPKEEKYWDHLKAVITHYRLPIHVWIIGTGQTAQEFEIDGGEK